MKIWTAKSRRLIIFSHDLCLCALAWLGAFWFRYNLEVIPEFALRNAFLSLPIVLIFQTVAFYYYKLYRSLWRYVSMSDLSHIIQSVFFTMGISAIAIYSATAFVGIPRSVFPLYVFLATGMLGAPRFIVRIFKEYRLRPQENSKVLIVGAGSAGEGLLRDLRGNRGERFHVMGFVDDDPYKKGQTIHGIKVLGPCKRIPRLVEKHAISKIFIALPSATSVQMRHVLSFCEETQASISTLPGLKDLVDGRVTIDSLRGVAIEDLLGREQASLDLSDAGDYLKGRTVLVTGAGGSIGSEVCRQLIQLKPARLIMLDHAEFNLYQLQQEFRSDSEIAFEFVLASLLDKPAIQNCLELYRPSVIFHAAAYKHVPLLEGQVRMAAKNNILGTYCIARAAISYQVDKFVLISTDKAVKPTNVMGATKRVSELICHALNAKGVTQFNCVRFGNVLGSVGSVVPLFKQQLEKGGPLTVTDERMTRYFMSIPEASRLIIQAMALGKGGETFVLDMGEPIQILYLAEQMIRLSGKEPYRDIPIEITGLRPGEKLYEELFYDREALAPTRCQKIMLRTAEEVDGDRLWQDIERIESACAICSESTILQVLMTLVPELAQSRQYGDTHESQLLHA